MRKVVILAVLAVVGQAHAAKWDKSNNPNFFNAVAKKKMVFNYNSLPAKAEVLDTRFGWSESYWPSNLGGIAYRWNSPNPRPFGYTFFTKEEVLKMSDKELSELSPSELYDIAMGDYDYTLSKKVLKKYSPNDFWWEGICHGWALAASNYAEPDKTIVTNKDGVKVPFGASDVKGLLSMHDAYNSKGIYARVGDRCSVEGKVEGEAFEEDGEVSFPSKKDAEKSQCADVNAGAFHVVLASMIGINSQGFVADVDRFNDVWNQPITGYDSTFIRDISLNSEDIKNGVDKKIQIQTKMTYGDELEFYTPEEASKGTLSFVSKDPVTGTGAQLNTTRAYEYILELDRFGNIIGGEWISESRPDMLWMKTKDVKFNSSKLPLEGLNIIYKPVKR